GIVSLAQSFDHAVQQFTDLWFLMLPLLVGFGVQVGLFSYMRGVAKTREATASVAAAGSMSTASMVACCAHHLTDILPIIGLSGAMIFLTEYQSFFLVLGILSNLVGVTFLLSVMKTHSLYNKRGSFERVAKYDLKLLRNVALVGSVFVLVLAFPWSVFLTPAEVVSAPTPAAALASVSSQKDFTIALAPLGDDQFRVSVEVTPVKVSSTENSEFEVAFNTHFVDLGFNVDEVSYLETGERKYLPLRWSGSPAGGHHRSGMLVFPPIDSGAESVKLVITADAGIKERVFEWSLKE
ncbi:MAG: hypothetical protein GOV15_02625, partial [Candidatus Diapherotrites archaeon]|nr:hypothetical protein [Candidatus Diapherotrites archaeon]